MPFGAIYAALFLAGTALVLLTQAAGLPWALRAPAVVLAVALSVALLLGRPWSRWAAAAAAGGLVVGARPMLLGDDPGVLALVVSLAALVSALLLLLPATGAFRRSTASGDEPARRGRGLELITGLSALAVLAAAAMVAPPAAPPRAGASPAEGRQLATGLADRVRWTDFGSGLERARRSGEPLLVAFVTDWCGYCKKMDRTTWNSPEVVSRFADLVAVRVDAEETRSRNGHSGAELARRFAVRGFPTLVLLDGEGRELGRVSGYLAPGRLLRWIEDVAGRGRGTDPLSVTNR